MRLWSLCVYQFGHEVESGCRFASDSRTDDKQYSECGGYCGERLISIAVFSQTINFADQIFLQPHFKDDESTAFPVYEDASETEEEEDIENTDNEDDYDDVAGYEVENSYVEEKEEAILALKEIAKNTG